MKARSYKLPRLSLLRLLLPPALIPHAQQSSREAESAVTEEVHEHRAAARKLQELRVDPWMMGTVGTT